MGNYSELYGKITFGNKSNLKEFKKRYNNLFFELDFNKLFVIYQDKYSDYIDLFFNPLYNSFKLLGYPTFFNEFMGLFRDSSDIIYYFHIFGDVEDESFFIFKGNSYEKNTFQIKLFRTDNGIIENEHYNLWHEDFLKTLNIYKCCK